MRLKLQTKLHKSMSKKFSNDSIGVVFNLKVSSTFLTLRNFLFCTVWFLMQINHQIDALDITVSCRLFYWFVFSIASSLSLSHLFVNSHKEVWFVSYGPFMVAFKLFRTNKNCRPLTKKSSYLFGNFFVLSNQKNSQTQWNG